MKKGGKEIREGRGKREGKFWGGPAVLNLQSLVLLDLGKGAHPPGSAITIQR